MKVKPGHKVRMEKAGFLVEYYRKKKLKTTAQLCAK